MKKTESACIASILLCVAISGCKPREFNQSRTKDLTGAAGDMITLCQLVAPSFETASGDAKAAFRVSCTGQCNGADYRGRKFYILNEEKVAGIEFSVATNAGNEVRNLYIYSPSENIMSTVKGLALDSPDVQRSLLQYGLDPAVITSLSLPADAKVLLLTGTQASLSNSGLLDGGTLDCGGQPVEGSVDMEQFKSQNLDDVRNAMTAPK
ncbi:MAG: hypothetical protein RIR26_2443 [Pseudomonadota bacterium]|jgi:hypothetical protein